MDCENIPAIVVGILDEDSNTYSPVLFEDPSRSKVYICKCIHEAWVRMRTMQAKVINTYLSGECDKSAIEIALTFALAQLPDGKVDSATWVIHPMSDKFIDNMRKAVTTGLVGASQFAETVSDNCLGV